MTHNTREVEEWEERFDMLFDHIKPLDKHIPAHIDTRDYADIKKFIHHQLQKARESEMERIAKILLADKNKVVQAVGKALLPNHSELDQYNK